jgi:LacI family transcriptional regulator
MTARWRAKPRLKELGAELNLSITTVSRALAGYSDVSAATTAKVRDLAMRMGYVPSRTGRALVSGSSGFVGLVLPPPQRRDPADTVSKLTFVDAFLGDYITVLVDALTRHGRDVTVTTASQNRPAIDALRHVVNGLQVDGVVVADRTSTHDDRVAYLIDSNVPFVVHGRVLDEPRPHIWVDTDGEAAFADAAKMLIGLGHRRFGLLTFAEPLTFAYHRQLGLERTLRRHGLHLGPETVADVGRFNDAGIAEAVYRLLTLDPRPTALFCATDALALKLVELACAMSINVPRDLSVIGFDNVPVSGYASPGLSTFDQHIADSATSIVDMLLRQLDGDIHEAENRAIKPDFIARGSHAHAPAA